MTGLVPRLALQMAAVLLVSGASLWGVFHALELAIDEHGAVMWAWAFGSAVGAGLLSARWSGRLAGREILVAVGGVLIVAGVAAVLFPGEEGLAGPRLRSLLVAPVILALAAYFGASLGFLVWGGGQDLRLGYEALVGRRFLLSKASPVLSTVTTISVIGVALGVWLVTGALAVLAGFERDLTNKIIGVGGHAVVQRDGGRNFELPDDLLERVRSTEGVVNSAPYVEGEVLVASSSNHTAGLLFGIDPEAGSEVLGVLDQIIKGSIRPLRREVRNEPQSSVADPEAEFAAPAAIPSVVIGKEMAKALNVRVGDRVRLVSPLLEVMTPIGVAPRSLSFRVAAVFSSKMYQFDAHYMFATLPATRRFFELDAPIISGLHVQTENAEFSHRVGHTLQAGLGESYAVLDWKRRNQTLFSALKLERVVTFVVLVFIILVASFSIVNTLTMSVIEKQKEIAILKTMGARSVGVMKLFLVQGMLVGLFGTGIGAAVAFVTTWALERYGFWIPGEVYYIDSLPVHLDTQDILLVILAALLIVWDFAVFPALRGSALKPVEGLRDG